MAAFMADFSAALEAHRMAALQLAASKRSSPADRNLKVKVA
jgi:hypothetical protein